MWIPVVVLALACVLSLWIQRELFQKKVEKYNADIQVWLARIFHPIAEKAATQVATAAELEAQTLRKMDDIERLLQTIIISQVRLGDAALRNDITNLMAALPSVSDPMNELLNAVRSMTPEEVASGIYNTPGRKQTRHKVGHDISSRGAGLPQV